MILSEEVDEIYLKLLKLTQQLIAEINIDNVDELANLIEERQIYIDRMYEAGDNNLTQQQRVLLEEIKKLDSEMSDSAQKLIENYKKDIKESQVKYDGITKYNNSRFDLSSGLLIDKRR